ncbi:mitochondrial 54S ribosomal protein bL19m NDAI_0I00550 [Naumovozyma dairenensis CBS 421]|uniref:KOW domain-containing protein n=1 Tax=Naumovozyma dairenensis (strain ATCC 10597 / BCRC 20456 / CBS 421 / NBRC 0211 / NRRL Y-12639) TaxID=1071378 RepID=G0WFR3_NAUDC|nr:hypothetical protein NDAI_0I00550 [Naumovozyma dairenensis CBS 421]CCD26624.1 hypothetical protein NDAI_0I00550 [Naumovozyma dairenensis CBS 421]
MWKSIIPRVSTKSNTIFNRCYQLPAINRKIIPVYPPVEPRSYASKDGSLLDKLAKLDVENTLDPQGWRRTLLEKSSKNSIKAGDIVRVTYDSKKSDNDNFVGYVLSVDRKRFIQDSSLLLRNQIGKTYVELRVPLFSPLIERIDLLRQNKGLRKRNKHYYIRNTRLDVHDLEAGLRRKK